MDGALDDSLRAVLADVPELAAAYLVQCLLDVANHIVAEQGLGSPDDAEDLGHCTRVSAEWGDSGISWCTST